MQIRPLVLSFLLSFSLPLAATIVPGAEKPVTAATPDVAAFAQRDGRIATDGIASYLAVWIDRDLTGRGDVHAQRVTPDGARVSDEVLQIAVTDANEGGVDVAFGSDRYLVTWYEPFDAFYGRFVGRDGSMSSAFVIAPADPAVAAAETHIAFNGSRFLVTWRGRFDYQGALVDLNGTVIKTFNIATRQLTPNEPAIVAVDGTFRFVSSIVDVGGVLTGNGYPGDIGSTPIDADGNIGTRVVVAPATTPVFDINAAVKGNEFAIAWSTAIGIPGGLVRAVRVTPAGAGAVESIPAEGQYLHELGADGGGFFVIYGADAEKSFQRLGSTIATTMAVPNTQNVVLDSANTLAIVRGVGRGGFEDGPAGDDLYVVRIDTFTIHALVVAPHHQQQPDIAAAGDLRLAAWCEYIGNERRLGIVASRLNATGDAIDTNGIDLGANVYHPSEARVASNGTDWLVAWVDAKNLYASRVARNGSLIDATPMLVASDVYESTEFAVSWDGSQYVLIFFRGQFLRGLHTTTRAIRIPSHGAITLPELTLSADGANDFPSIASRGDGSLVVWRGGTTLAGVLLSLGGTSTPISFPGTPTLMPRPTVAWNNGTYLVAGVFRGSFGDEVQWLRVSATGVVTTVVSTFPDTTGDAVGSSPSIDVEAYREDFLVYWRGAGSETLYAARVNDAGVLVDAPKAIGTSLVDWPPQIGATGNMVVYARKIGHATKETARVFTRVIAAEPGQPRRRAARK